MSILEWLEALLPRGGARSARRLCRRADVAVTRRRDASARRHARAAFDAGLAAYAAHGLFATAIECFKAGDCRAPRRCGCAQQSRLELSRTGSQRGRHGQLSCWRCIFGRIFRRRFTTWRWRRASLATRRSRGESRAGDRAASRILPPPTTRSGYVLSHETGDFERGAAHIRQSAGAQSGRSRRAVQLQRGA